MASLNRETLDKAASLYFAELQRIADQPRDLPDEHFDQELDFQISETRAELGRFDGLLLSRRFETFEPAARRMLKAVGADFDSLDPEAQANALIYAVRAERQQMLYLLHSLTQPVATFTTDDELFAPSVSSPAPHLTTLQVVDAGKPLLRPEITLERGIDTRPTISRSSASSLTCGSRAKTTRSSAD